MCLRFTVTSGDKARLFIHLSHGIKMNKAGGCGRFNTRCTLQTAEAANYVHFTSYPAELCYKIPSLNNTLSKTCNSLKLALKGSRQKDLSKSWNIDVVPLGFVFSIGPDWRNDDHTIYIVLKSRSMYEAIYINNLLNNANPNQ